VYHEANLTDLVVVDDAEKARLAQQACTEDIVDNTTKPLDEIFRSDPQDSETWAVAAKTNSVTVGATTAPVMLTHGDADTVVPVSGTLAFFAWICAGRGHRVPARRLGSRAPGYRRSLTSARGSPSRIAELPRTDCPWRQGDL
jgi:hypothetical protein